MVLQLPDKKKGGFNGKQYPLACLSSHNVTSFVSDGEPPYDGSAIDVVHPIALALIIIYDMLAFVALLFAVACALFNIICRNKK